MVTTKKVRTASGGEYDAPDYVTYKVDGVWRQDYEANTPRQFVSTQEQIVELKREIQRLERLQLQHTLMFNPAARAALDPEIQDLRQQLQVLEGGA
jgi:hypothetical protein